MCVAMGGGMLAMAIGAGAENASWRILLPGCVLAGSGLGAINAPFTNTTTSSMPSNHSGMDTSARLISLCFSAIDLPWPTLAHVHVHAHVPWQWPVRSRSGTVVTPWHRLPTNRTCQEAAEGRAKHAWRRSPGRRWLAPKSDGLWRRPSTASGQERTPALAPVNVPNQERQLPFLAAGYAHGRFLVNQVALEQTSG